MNQAVTSRESDPPIIQRLALDALAILIACAAPAVVFVVITSDLVGGAFGLAGLFCIPAILANRVAAYYGLKYAYQNLLFFGLSLAIGPTFLGPYIFGSVDGAAYGISIALFSSFVIGTVASFIYLFFLDRQRDATNK